MNFSESIWAVWIKRMSERCRIDLCARPGALGLVLYLIGLGTLSLSMHWDLGASGRHLIRLYIDLGSLGLLVD